MEDPNKIAETEDTAAQTEGQATQVAGAPAEAGKAADDKKGADKVDLNRLIEEEGYAEKVLAEKAGERQGEAAESEVVEGAAPVEGEAGAKPKEELTIVVKNGGTEERIPISQAQNRLNQAAHLQRIWQTEVAPLARVIRDNPLLSQALAEASRGDRTRLDAMLAIASQQPKPGETAQQHGDRLDKALEKLKGRKEIEGWKPEEIKANMAVIAAMQDALKEEPPPGGDRARLEQDFSVEARAIETESSKLKAVLAEANPDGHAKTMEAVGVIVKEMYKKVQQGEVSPEVFAHTMALYNDPRQVDEAGRPMFMRLYRAGQEFLRAQGQAAARPGGGVNARIAPGAARGAATTGSLPSLKGKTREERIALMDQFMGS